MGRQGLYVVGLVCVVVIGGLAVRVGAPPPQADIEALPEMGRIATPAHERVEYVLPGVRETTMPPISRRGDARAIVEFIHPEAVASACAGAMVVSGTYGEPLACTRMEPGRPTVVMPNPCSFPWDAYAAMLCHEVGHVNGWTHDREGVL